MSAQTGLNLLVLGGVLAAAIGFLIWCGRGGQDLRPLAAALAPDDDPSRPFSPSSAPSSRVTLGPRPQPDRERQDRSYFRNLTRPIGIALVATLLFALMMRVTPSGGGRLIGVTVLLYGCWLLSQADPLEPLTPAELVADTLAREQALVTHIVLILLGCLPFSISALHPGRFWAFALLIDAVAAWRLLSPFSARNAMVLAALAAYDAPKAPAKTPARPPTQLGFLDEFFLMVFGEIVGRIIIGVIFIIVLQLLRGVGQAIAALFSG